MSLDFESLFHASSVELLVPSFSQCPAYPSNPSDPSSSRSWWTEAQAARARDTAFLDEKLAYYVGMHIDDGAGTDEPSQELKRFLSHLQLSMSVSFLPPMKLDRPHRGQETGQSLLPPDTTPTGGETDLDFPPVTPMPRPSVREEDERYAGLDGQVVWEGEVVDKYRMFKDDKSGWNAVWRGEVNVAYVRTNIQDPVLSLTASVTLRDGPLGKRHRKGNFSIDTVSTRTAGEDFGDEEQPASSGGLTSMRDMDLLGGLAGETTGLPATRLGRSLRQDLSLPDPVTSASLPSSAFTPSSIPSSTPTMSGTSPSGPSRDRPAALSTINDTSPSTLRKSFRRVLALSPGLRVRMRTLFLPQLLPVSSTPPNEDENEGERKVVLCVEVENPETESAGMSFEIESVKVEVGGKGGQATASLVCQPEQRQDGGKVFPLRLAGVEQYNLLYAVNIASAPEERNGGADEAALRNMGRGDDTRPAAITLVGRPFRLLDGAKELEYPTDVFSSRWNCQLDLTAFYASLASGAHAVPTASTTSTNRLSKSSLALPPPAPNAVAGDKRYSLATIMSQGSGGSNRDSRRLTAQRPIMPSQAMSSHHTRTPSTRQAPSAGTDEGLLVSVKLLPRSTSASTPLPNGSDGVESSRKDTIVKPFEPFSIEVFVHNRTEEVRRFRLAIPPRDGENQVREIMDKRRSQNPQISQDDPVLRKLLAKHLASAPAIVPLETDVRCGPLLPGASLAARLRFMALRPGVHKVEKLIVTGMGDDWNFVMSPVLDVIVD